VPVYTYQFEDGERVDRLFMSWRDSPAEITELGRIGRKVPTTFNSRFPNPSAQTAERDGLVPYEAGMDRDWKRAREDREKKADEVRRQVIAETLADIPL
jgi:hypothetical protein